MMKRLITLIKLKLPITLWIILILGGSVYSIGNGKLSMIKLFEVMEREIFDYDLYKKVQESEKGYYIKPNGNIIHSMSKGDPSVYYEIVNKYPYYQIYREFYPNDYL